MKLIVAVVRPFTIDRLLVTLEDIKNFPGLTMVDSEGFGQRLASSSDAFNPFKPNKRIEIVAPDEMVEEIVVAIRAAAHTGKKGDGIVYVLPLEKSALIFQIKAGGEENVDDFAGQRPASSAPGP